MAEPPDVINTDPDMGFVNIRIEGTYTVTDTHGDKFPTEGVKAMNIAGYGCIVVRWRGGKTYTETSYPLHNVYVIENDGEFILRGEGK